MVRKGKDERAKGKKKEGLRRRGGDIAELSAPDALLYKQSTDPGRLTPRRSHTFKPVSKT